jgi:hypothetical protein
MTSAQSYGVINDKDGFVNVRKSPGVNSPIVGKIYTDQLFGYDYEKQEGSSWVQIIQQNSGLEGYISRNKISPLSKFKSIGKIKLYKDSCIASNDSISVIIKSSSFKKQQHKLQYNRPGKNESAFLLKIDGKEFWGADGDAPKREISLIKIIKNGLPVDIPKSAYNDLYEPNFSSYSINIYINSNTIYIKMANSDGAGGYTVIWVIKDNKFYKRYIDNAMA